MIYLNNNTNPQEIFIERNDGNGYIHTGSSQSYQEGYEDGIEYQKSLLSSSAFTENGEYERENGWSAITVNVEPSLEEINVVISADTTTITPSSGYDGFSSVTIDATEYGQENYDSGFDDGYTDGYSSGSTDGFNSGFTSGETHQKSLLGNTAFTINGSYSAENGYSAITVNVPQTGSTAVLGVGSFSANGTYSASTDNLDGYSAITINVPTGMTSKDIIICVSGGCWFNTNYDLVFGDSIEIEHCTFGTYDFHSTIHQQYIGGGTGEILRIGQAGWNHIYIKYFNNPNSWVLPISASPTEQKYAIEDKTVVMNSTGFSIDGTVICAYTATYNSVTPKLTFFANTSSGGDVVNRQTAKMGRVKIYGSDGTLKATFEPRLDNLNVPYFKYVEQDIDIYASGSGTPLYEILDPMYNSGYTDGYTNGYTNGYTDGSATIASLIDRSITEAVIPSGVTKIGGYAFSYCSSLSSVTIPNSVTRIDGNAFQYCRSLSSITIPNSVTSIGSNAFASCSSLSSVTIPNSVTRIDGNAFQNCSALTEVNIGSGVTNIGAQAFRNCIALSNIYISATTAPTISNANAFQGVPSTGTVHYPQGSDYSSWQSNTYLSGWTFVGDL